MTKEDIKKAILAITPSNSLDSINLLLDYIDASIEEIEISKYK